MIEDRWYKNAIIYCLDVETFQDGNGDGIGDFRGLEGRLDYLAGLGVTCIWLLPFFSSPNRDNGYDITDFYSVDSRLGDLGDFVRFSHQAKLHGIRVIVDLVVNHTSDRHPWFQAARSKPDSPFRDFYIWSKAKPKNAHKGMVFPGVQTTTWTWDEKAKAYYFHRFHDFQPDLNVANPLVREEIFKIMGFWLELGVSGFRVDAVPFVIEAKSEAERADLPDPYVFLSEMREFLSWRSGDAILLAEANVDLKESLKFFGNGDRMQMVFNFLANQQLFSALASGDARGLADVLRKLPRLHESTQWASFLRNHDELDLGRLPDEERKRTFEKLGPDPDMQLYDRGLRRRLAPMLDGDARKLQMAYSLMFSLPGTPVLWYGDEIGMGERLSLPEREAVRTPMQWSGERHAGFTRGKRPLKPLVDEGPFSYERVNVADQRRDPNALLNWMERTIRLRRESPELGWGVPKVLAARQASVLAIRYDWRGSTMVTVHNFSAKPTVAQLSPVNDERLPLVCVLTGTRVEFPRGRPAKLSLEGYGYHWFRVGGQDRATIAQRQ